MVFAAPVPACMVNRLLDALLTNCRRELNKLAARRQRDKRKARDSELVSIRGVLVEEQRHKEQTEVRCTQAEARAATAELQRDHLALRLEIAEATATEALRQLAIRLHTAQARATEALNEHSKLAIRLDSSEARLRERSASVAFFESQMANVTTISSDPHTPSPSAGSDFVPGPFSPFY